MCVEQFYKIFLGIKNHVSTILSQMFTQVDHVIKSIRRNNKSQRFLTCTTKAILMTTVMNFNSQNCSFILDVKQVFCSKKMFGRTLKCKIAKDNGRATEFIKRKYYTDKSRCYECGVRSQHCKQLC